MARETVSQYRILVDLIRSALTVSANGDDDESTNVQVVTQRAQVIRIVLDILRTNQERSSKDAISRAARTLARMSDLYPVDSESTEVRS